MKSYLYLAMILFCLSCGNKDIYPSGYNGLYLCGETDQRLTMEVIIDDLDWSDYLHLQESLEIENSKSVGQIKIPSLNASCTAFLINENSIMTNNHCVSVQRQAIGVRLFLRGPNQNREVFNCDKLLTTNSTLDFSILECDGKPGQVFGHLPLGTVAPALNTQMYVIQENCDYQNNPYCEIHKYLSRGAIQKVTSNSLSHNADTLGGSSGSPVFSQGTHQLVGLHHAGKLASGTLPAVNYAIPINKIASYLEKNNPEIRFSRARHDLILDDPYPEDRADAIISDRPCLL